jgi:hypothetical protein
MNKVYLFGSLLRKVFSLLFWRPGRMFPFFPNTGEET